MYLFKEICPKCGGKLTDDYERRISTCQVCGNVFEAEYISVDKSLDNADALYKNELYSDALSLYSYVLAEAPDSCRALDGFVRCLGKADSIANVTAFLDKGAFTMTKEDLEICKAKCGEDRGAYFDVVEKVISASREYIKTISKTQDKLLAIRAIQSEIARIRNEKGNIVKNYDNPDQNKRTMVLLPVLLIFCILVAIAFIVLDIYAYLESIAVGIMGSILAIMGVACVIGLWRVNTKFIRAIRHDHKLHEDLVKSLEEKKAIDSECKKVLGNINGLLGKAKLIVSKNV